MVFFKASQLKKFACLLSNKRLAITGHVIDNLFYMHKASQME